MVVGTKGNAMPFTFSTEVDNRNAPIPLLIIESTLIPAWALVLISTLEALSFHPKVGNGFCLLLTGSEDCQVESCLTNVIGQVNILCLNLCIARICDRVCWKELFFN